jgi:BASS family bile acid:Na+ symporter|tara:strand:+ start:244 stop:1098 length:855 start_codon:yes stop_codon:yes gene_type:complete
MELVKLIGPLVLAFIMFSLGIGLSLENFKRVILQPKDFIIGAISQVIILPIVALILIFLFPIPTELKIGLILLAAAPGGITTNVITKFAKGDVALSITLTAVISLLCFITIPLIFSLTYPIITGQVLPFDYSIGSIIVQIFLITTVPVILGMIFKTLFPNFFSRTENFFVKFSFILFVFFLFMAIYQELPNIVEYFAASGLITLILNIIVLIVAYFLCNIFSINTPQKKTILIETGLQNGTLAIVVTSLIFNEGIYLVPIATYALIMYGVILLYIFGLKIFNNN